MLLGDNRNKIRRNILEDHALNALQTHLMQDNMLKIFCDEFMMHLNHLHKEKNAAHKSNQDELIKLEKERKNLIQAIKDGIPASEIKDDLARVSRRQETLEQLLKAQSAPKPLLHPALASRFHESVKNLRHELNKDGTRNEATQHLRGLVDKIVLTPIQGKNDLQIDLYGDLAKILNMAIKDKNMKSLKSIDRLQLFPANDNSCLAKQDSNGSGAGFEPTTFPGLLNHESVYSSGS